MVNCLKKLSNEIEFIVTGVFRVKSNNLEKKAGVQSNIVTEDEEIGRVQGAIEIEIFGHIYRC